MTDASEPTPPTPAVVPPGPRKKQRRLLLLLGLVFLGGGAATWIIIKRGPPPKLPDFTQQGETNIATGSLVMKVWDSEAEDGDVIQVYFNGKILAAELPILNTPVEYKLGWVFRGEYLIGIKALNEGASSPASVTVSLSDGLIEKEFGMDATLERAASWKVNVK